MAVFAVMSENATPNTTPSTASASTTKPATPPKPQNPVFKMMGMFVVILAIKVETED